MEEQNKMYIEIYDNRTKIFESEDIKTIVQNLMYYTYSVAFNKNKNVKCKYNYNYTDKQTLHIIEKDELNKREIIIYNVPTSWGALDTYKMFENLEEKEV